MARTQLRVDAEERDLAACHRLKRDQDAGIIARFVDLNQRDRWLENAKHLRDTKISMNVDLPPCLRPLKTELMGIRKKLPPDVKRRSTVKHLPKWPYLVLKRPDQTEPTNHTFSKAAVALSAVNMTGSFEHKITGV